MKLITRYVEIENQEFCLIKDTQTDCNGERYTYYGTIPYTEVDEHGCLKRQLNGFDMCIADTAQQALARREQDIKVTKAINEFIALGFSTDEAIMKAFGF